MSGIQKFQFDHAQILYILDLKYKKWAEKMFCIKVLLILPKFLEKTLSCSGDIKLLYETSLTNC